MLKRIEKYIIWSVLIITWLIFILIILLDAFRFLQNDWQNKGKVDSFSRIDEIYVEEVEEDEEKIESLPTTKIASRRKIGKVNIFSSNSWRIKIPKLNVNAPITEGTEAEDLRRTVGHFSGSAKWNGNVALAGHNRGYRCNFFQDIKTLKKGDVIIYCTQKGERKYQVVVNQLIKETDWKYIQNTKDNRITLITCEINKREYRRCIQAVEVK